jgi:hypothetical protein
MKSYRSVLAFLALVCALAAPAAAQEDPAAPPPDAPPAVAPVSPNEVSFMDFTTVEPSALCGRLASSSAEEILNLRRFAAFEAVHNSRGAADKARAVVDCIDGSGLMDAISSDAPAAPVSSESLDVPGPTEPLPEP